MFTPTRSLKLNRTSTDLRSRPCKQDHLALFTVSHFRDDHPFYLRGTSCTFSSTRGLRLRSKQWKYFLLPLNSHPFIGKGVQLLSHSWTVNLRRHSINQIETQGEKLTRPLPDQCTWWLHFISSLTPRSGWHPFKRGPRPTQGHLSSWWGLATLIVPERRPGENLRGTPIGKQYSGSNKPLKRSVRSPCLPWCVGRVPEC